MKKALASLLLAAVMFSSGCGGDAGKAAEDAQAAVENVKDAAGEVKDAAGNVVTGAVDAVKALADDAAAAMDSIKNGDKKVYGLGGVVPGANVDAAKNLYGEPVITDGAMMGFENGLDITVDNNSIQTVSTTYDGIYTPADVGVGMGDYTLNSAYGSATSVTNMDNGDVVYRYLSTDNRRALEFTTRSGVIVEIKCALNK